MLGFYLLPLFLALTKGYPSIESRRYEPHDLCPKDSSHHLLPHEYDCTKFYYCEYGLKWVTPRDCAPGTEFSYDLQVCVHPSMANCNLPGYPTDPPTDATSETEPSTTTTEAATTTTTTEATTTSTTQAPTTTTTEAATTTTTTEATTTTTTQAPTTTEAATTTTTEAPTTTTTEAATTTTTLAPTTPTTEASTTTTEASTTTEARPSTTQAPSEPSTEETDEPNQEVDLLPNGCPKDFEIHMLLPHETDCDKFYYCNFGKKVLRDCAPGTYFNPALQVCDWPENVECANGNGEDNESSVDGNGGDSNESNNGESSIEDGDDNNGNGSDDVDSDNQSLDNDNSNEDDGSDGGDNDSGSDGDNGTGDSDNESGDNDNESGDNDNSSGDSEGGVLANGCPADWNVNQLLPHNNCRKFYQCVHGEKVVMNCPAGLHFNAELQVCDWPSAAGCQSNSGTDESNEDGNGSDGDDNDNGSDGDNGTEENDNESGDNDNESGDNDNESGDNDNESGDNDNESGDNDNESGDNDNESGGNDNENGDNDNLSGDSEGGVLPNGCPADWNVNQLLPHSNCRKFYQCVHGEKVVMTCPAGLHFNAELQVCDWPSAAGCQSNSGTDESNEDGDDNNGNGSDGDDKDNGSDGDNGTEENDNKSGDNDNESGDNDNESGDNDNESGDNDNESGDNDNSSGDSEVGILPNGCPADWNVNQLLPHSNCGKFYQCVHGEKVVMSCPSGLHFNAELQVCDWPSAAGCESGNNSSSGEDSGNASEENGSGDENNSNGGDENSDNGSGEDGNPSGDNNGSDENNNSNEDNDTGSGDNDNSSGDNDNSSGDSESGVLPNGCPADWNVNQLLPHSDCGKFYQCVHGEKVVMSCPSGLHFNAALQVCDWPSAAGCQSNSSSDESNEDGDDNNGNGSDGDDSDNGSDGDNGTGDSDNESGDNNNESGDNDNSSGDSEGGVLPNGCPADWNVNQLLPHSDCGKFYQCVHGEKVVMTCPTGLHFNAELQVCDWPSAAGCESGNNSGSGEDSGNDSNGDEDSTNGGDSDGDNGSGDNDNSSGDSEVGILPNGCPADWNVNQLLPHSDCGKFYQCVHGEKVVMSCPAGLHFNAELQVCDWPSAAGCESGNNSSSGEDSVNGSEENGSEDENNSGGDDEDSDNGSGDNGNSSGDNNGSDENNISNEDNDNGSGDNDISDENNNSSGDNDNATGDNEANRCADSCNILPWAHETACDKYWTCVGDELTMVICSEGLHFNVITGTCDFICNAGCTRTNIQSTADANGLNIFVPWEKVGDSVAFLPQ